MNSKTLVVAGLATAALLGAGLYLSSREPGTAAATAGGRMFPELSPRVNDVTEVTIQDGTSTFSVRKDGATWGAADKGGFPVDFDKVKALVVGIAEFQLVEAMTSNAQFHAKLGVEEPGTEGASSKRVSLKDASGKLLADVILGRAKQNQGMVSKPSLYARRVGEDQVWEVTGSISVASDSAGWLDREISKIESTRVASAVVRHPDGEVLTVRKNEPGQQDFTVENLPEGKELSWSGVANGISSALQYMSLDDVQRNEGFDLEGATVTEYACFDGLVVTARSVERDGKNWITLEARLDEALRAEPVGPEAPPPAEGEAPPTPPKPALKELDLVRKEVDELNAKWSPWVFAVPGYNAANLRKRMTDLLKQDLPAGGALEDSGIDVFEDITDESHADAGVEHAHDDGASHVEPAPSEPVPVQKPDDGR